MRCLIDFLIFLILIFTTASAEEVYVNSYAVERNETLTVPVYVNVSENILGLDITMKFDPNVVIVQDVKLNSSYQCKDGCFWFKNTGNNFVKVALIDTNGVKAKDIPVIDVIFEVVGNPGDVTEIELYANLSDSNYNLIKAETSNGFITVAGSPVTTTTVIATTTATQTIATTAVMEETTVTETTVTTPTTTVITSTVTVTTTTTTPTAVTTIQVTTTEQATYHIQKTEQTTVIVNKTEKVEVTKDVHGFTIILCVLSIAIAFILRKRS